MVPQGNHLWRCMCKCYVLYTVFAFVFTPSPLKRITCNRQWLNSVLLPFLLKFWVWVLNYKCPNKCVFYFFMALFVIFLSFLLWNLPKFSQHIATCGVWILNKERKVRFVQAVFSILANLCILPLWKYWSDRYPWKTAPTEVKYLLPVCQILANFTEGNARKFTVIFTFCAHVVVIKYKKTLTFLFKHAQITRAFVFSAHAIIKL